MSCQSFDLHSWWRILAFACLLVRSLGLNPDGILLLSFKYAILSDPLGVLDSWNYFDLTPCSWNGVTCSYSRVIALSLANSQLLGSIPADLGLIQHLRNLNLSKNSINGYLPSSLFSASELQILDLSNNFISGELPELVGGLTNLELLDLSDNGLAGRIPESLTTLYKLNVVSLRNNYFSGSFPGGFNSVVSLDLSSNLINGSLPLNFTGTNLQYFNLSYNRLSGEIPPEFGTQIPTNATIDLSFNNFTGEIPKSSVFLNQEAKSYAGNPELCGKPLMNPCSIPSSISSTPPNASEPTTSPPAVAAIPKTINSAPATTTSPPGPAKNGRSRNGLRPGTIAGIVVGDFLGVVILALIFLNFYQWKKKERGVANTTNSAKPNGAKGRDGSSYSSEESKGNRAWACLRNQPNDDDEEESSEITNSDAEEVEEVKTRNRGGNRPAEQEQKRGELVTVNGEKELEIETLLKASAYILGATGSSIVYKAVLEDGTAVAVRRIGESAVERFREFENQVRAIAKLVHPNLVRIRGFYWGDDEKLVIYDFVPNGSLANARYIRSCGGVVATKNLVFNAPKVNRISSSRSFFLDHSARPNQPVQDLGGTFGLEFFDQSSELTCNFSGKVGSSPCHLQWEVRLRIARGVARGLTYVHDKKHVHGNLKPSNILLGLDMEPKIGDFGLEKLMTGESGYRAGGSAQTFGSKRSTASRDSFQDTAIGPTPSPSPSSLGCISPYHAPESLRNLKPNPKWDVYSFGVVLLELLAGKIVVSDEVGSGHNEILAVENDRVLKMADATIRGDLEGKENALSGLFKLGFSCISPVPQKRPTMKEVLHVLEKFPSSSSNYYGH
ncbi:hypothetical protein U1Q18_011917 [Sarracenia purpurea var. burkii]